MYLILVFDLCVAAAYRCCRLPLVAVLFKRGDSLIVIYRMQDSHSGQEMLVGKMT